jgi:serine O-acetyltransferase
MRPKLLNSIRAISNKIIISFDFIRIVPFVFIFRTHRKRQIIKSDVKRWLKVYGPNMKTESGFIYLMLNFKEFRSLFYCRVGSYGLLNLILRKNTTLLINTTDIGKCLFIQHGDLTVIEAKSIGDNCQINQMVSIMGYFNECGPTLLDNVTVYAGAKVMGNITIGNNSIIGANSSVEKDVPDNCIVAGVPGIIISRNGIKVKEPL